MRASPRTRALRQPSHGGILKPHGALKGINRLWFLLRVCELENHPKNVRGKISEKFAMAPRSSSLTNCKRLPELVPTVTWKTPDLRWALNNGKVPSSRNLDFFLLSRTSCFTTRGYPGSWIAPNSSLSIESPWFWASPHFRKNSHNKKPLNSERCFERP